MCYEYSSWFRKARAKETHKLMKKADEQQRSSAPAPLQPAEIQQSERAREPEKTPA